MYVYIYRRPLLPLSTHKHTHFFKNPISSFPQFFSLLVQDHHHHHLNQEMEAPFDPKSDNSGIPTPSPMEKNGGESSLPCSSLGMEKDNMKEYWRKEMMKVKNPLPPRQPKTTSSVLPPSPPPPPAEKSRVSRSLDRAVERELIHGRHLDPGLDGKTIRRTISNRLSAQRSRMKKSQYLTNMEKKAQDLEKLVYSLTPKVEVYEEKKRLLQLENDSLRAQVEIREAQSKISQDGLEQRRREIIELKEMLRQKGVELLPPPLLENIPIPGPQEQTIQVSGPQEQTMQVPGPQEQTIRVSGPQEQIMQVSGPHDQTMQVEVSGPDDQIMPVSGLDEQALVEFSGLDEQIMQASGQDEHVMQVEGSGLDDQMMQFSGLDEHVMQFSGPEEVGPKPYSIEFYQQQLMQMEMNQFIENELSAGRAAGPSSMPEIESMIEMSFNEEEEVEVDQYLNLDGDPDHA